MYILYRRLSIILSILSISLVVSLNALAFEVNGFGGNFENSTEEMQSLIKKNVLNIINKAKVKLGTELIIEIEGCKPLKVQFDIITLNKESSNTENDLEKKRILISKIVNMLENYKIGNGWVRIIIKNDDFSTNKEIFTITRKDFFLDWGESIIIQLIGLGEYDFRLVGEYTKQHYYKNKVFISDINRHCCMRFTAPMRPSDVIDPNKPEYKGQNYAAILSGGSVQTSKIIVGADGRMCKEWCE